VTTVCIRSNINTGLAPQTP